MTRTNIRQVTIVVFLFTTAVYFARPLHAQGYSDTQPQSSDTRIPSFSQLDTNKDGFVDRNEAAAAPALLKIWTQADADKDGKLSAEEFSAAQSSMPSSK
ncbi:MAG TPA: hypothetical protein VFW00_04600 [Rhodocyclaceae bacterium]|nr:hypothetical protein [Rhodocyclaceae bacterium]